MQTHSQTHVATSDIDLSIYKRILEAMRTLAVAQQKGGVGKTVTSINTAGALVAHGKDVCLVDADPQGGATVNLGYRDEYLNDDLTLYDVLTGDVDEFDRINELIHEHPEFDVVGASARDVQYEPESHTLPRTYERLGLALERIEKSYDYIVIDCPPSMGSLTDGALLYADSALLVSRPSPIATFSLELLFKEIDTLEATFGTSIGIVGAVVNAVTRNSIADERLQWFKESFGDNYVTVPETVAIEDAQEQHSSVYGFVGSNRHRKQKGAEVRERYDEIADMVEAHYNA